MSDEETAARPSERWARGCDMGGIEIGEVVRQGMNTGLVWIGFGTMAGLLAKAVMPGRDPGGAVSTVLIGVAGSVIGSGTLLFFWDGARVKPMSFLGFVIAAIGAFILLFFYRLLAGYYFVESVDGGPAPRRLRSLRRRRKVTVTQDE